MGSRMAGPVKKAREKKGPGKNESEGKKTSMGQKKLLTK
jgi:hypothetical protein